MTYLLKSFVFIFVALWAIPTSAESEILISPSSSVDTIVVERVDASDFILAFLYSYFEGDTAATSKMQRKEREFLKSQNLPTTGVAELNVSAHLDMDSLIANYDKATKILKNSPHRDLYRRVCSDMIVKYICSSNKIDGVNMTLPQNKLIYFLNEMKESKSINIELIYTAFLKLQYHNSFKNLCQGLSLFLPYYRNGVARSESDYSNIKANEKKNNRYSFILEMEGARLKSRKEYLADLLRMQSVVCK